MECENKTETGRYPSDSSPAVESQNGADAVCSDPKPPLMPRKKRSNFRRNEFSIRHSSYSGGALSKLGMEYFLNNQNNGNPIIVFDHHSSDADEPAQIKLDVRQPSFVSLHGSVIPKGSDSISNFMPFVEEVEPLPKPEIKMSDAGDDEDSRQIMMAKELQAKHKNIWKRIGYKPPKDLIPKKKSNDKNESSENKGESEIDNEGGSQGTTVKRTIRKSLSSDYLDYQLRCSSENNGKNSNEEEDEEKLNDDGLLFGRLREIVTEPPDSLLFQTLKTGAVDINNPNIHDIYSKLVYYANQTKEFLWLQENLYLNEIINAIDTAGSSHTKKKSRKDKKPRSNEKRKRDKSKI